MKSRYISFVEWERAAELLDDKWAAIIYTGIYTGLRYSDLCQLTPRMILEPADRVIELVEKKTTRPRAIKLHKKLIYINRHRHTKTIKVATFTIIKYFKCRPMSSVSIISIL